MPDRRHTKFSTRPGSARRDRDGAAALCVRMTDETELVVAAPADERTDGGHLLLYTERSRSKKER